MDKIEPTVSELIVEGFSDGGFRAEHALAVAMADASPKLFKGCIDAISFLETVPRSPERNALILQLKSAVGNARTPAVENAS